MSCALRAAASFVVCRLLMERSIIMVVNAVITASGTFSRKAPIAERDRDRIIGQTSETTLENGLNIRRVRMARNNYD